MKTSRTLLQTTIFSCSATALLTLYLPAARAQYTPALQFSGQSANGTASASTRGYSFDVTDPNGILVTALSFYDVGADGLSQSHDVGLWNASGTLLASATVPAGTAAPLDSSGLFRFVPITPITLPRGANYAVGAVFTFESFDAQAILWTAQTTAPGVQYDQARFINNGVPTLTFPTDTIAWTGLPGGSFNMSTIPEPSAAALLGVAWFALLVSRRRRVQASKLLHHYPT